MGIQTFTVPSLGLNDAGITRASSKFRVYSKTKMFEIFQNANILTEVRKHGISDRLSESYQLEYLAPNGLFRDLMSIGHEPTGGVSQGNVVYGSLVCSTERVAAT